MVLRAIADAEGIAVTDEEIEDEINKIVSGAANPEQMQKVYSADRYMRSVLRNEMYDERLSNHLIASATEGKGATLNGYDPDAEASAVEDKPKKKKSSKKAAESTDDAAEEPAEEAQAES